MRVIESGMPSEEYWNSLFDIGAIVEWLQLHEVSGSVVEIGCGYGTFTVPVARAFRGEVFGLDIEQAMIDTTSRNVVEAGLTNVHLLLRDVVKNGTGLGSGKAGLVLLFNILHSADNQSLLEEAARILKDSGVVAIIHWRKDISTPRGPRLYLRPDRDKILETIKGVDLVDAGNSRILAHYHWGMKLRKETLR